VITLCTIYSNKGERYHFQEFRRRGQPSGWKEVFNCLYVLLVCCCSLLIWFCFLCLLPADSAAAGLFAYWKQCDALKFHLCVVLHGLKCLLCTLMLFLFEQP